MRLFVGLGNPGGKYAGNRHNIGYMALDKIAADHDFGPWRSKFQGVIAEGRLGGEKVLALKPETFMNLSGQSVGEAMRFYKLEPADVTVFYDELDLAPGKLRVKAGGGLAGHNGLRSINAHIGADFTRVRMGIGHPGHKDRVSGYVLSDFAKADQEWLADLLQGVSDGAGELAAGDPGKFMNAVALRTAPPRSSKTDAKPRPATAPSAPAPAPTPKPPARSGPDTAPRTEAEPDSRTPLQKLMDRFR